MRPNRALPFVLVLVLATTTAARAGDAAAVRDIVDRYLESGELDAAREALAQKGATPESLLKELRATRPREEYLGGERKEALEDGHGTTTDLFISAPSEAEAAAAAKEGGLTTVIALHGLGGNGRQFLPLAKRLGPNGRTLVLAPTAQKLPQGLENDDVPIFDVGVPHWWLYRSERSFVFEALRHARRRYPIDPDRVILFGYSMGGFGTWNIGLRFADRFAGIAPCAGGLSRREIFSEKDETARELLVNARFLSPWFTHGDADQTVPTSLSRKLHGALDELKIAHTYEEVPGGRHILPLVRFEGNFPSLAKWAGARRRQPAPPRLEFVSAGDYADGAFWLRVGRRSEKKGNVRLAGAVDRAQNRVEVEVEGPASAVDVYLDDRLLDLSKTVTVAVKGQAPWRGRAKPDFAAVLESWRSREDPKLVYPARVRIELGKQFR